MVFFQPWYTTLIQIFAILVTLAVFVIMVLQLHDIRHEQAIALRPYLSLEIDPPGSATQLAELRNKGREDEIWGLGYYMQNVGKYPANGIFFKADWSTSPNYEYPSNFDNKEPQLINPSLKILAIVKTIPRSEVVRVTDKGERVYRHFYVRYKDKDGKSYFSSATWVLSDYKIGSSIKWELVTNNGD